MDTNRARQLLDKYYDGKTSAAEELQLQQYFIGEVPEEFQIDKEIFEVMAVEKSASNPNFDIGKMLEDLIDEQDIPNARKSIKLNTFSVAWVYRIAAVIALAFTVYFANNYLISPKIAQEESTEIRDTYENPELAYLETKKALLYLSAQLNKGTDELKNIQKLNQSIEQLTKLSEIDKAKNLLLQEQENGDEN